jgi:sec-independent protein translocase protein TatA
VITDERYPHREVRRVLGDNMDVGPAELLIVLVVLLLMFGSKKLPQLARGIGEAAHEFRRAQESDDDTK